MDERASVTFSVMSPRREVLRWFDTIVVAAAAACVLIAHAGHPVQSWVMFCFMVLYPGMPYVRMLRLRSLLIEVTLAIALSLALDVIVAEVMVYARHFSTDLGVAALIAIALMGVGFQVRTSVAARSARGSP